MSAIQTVMYDLTTICFLMFIAYFIRQKVYIFQDLYIPVSLIAGFIGLFLGPQVLGKFSPLFFPISNTLGGWASWALALVWAVPGLYKKSGNVGKIAISAYIVGAIGHQSQIVSGMLCASLFASAYGFNASAFGMTPAFGFYGGHGSALSAGTVLKDMGWAEGLDVANTFATIGLVLGVIIGTAYINYHARKGHTKYIREARVMTRAEKIGYIEPADRKPIGLAVTSQDVLDPIGYTLAWAGFIMMCGRLLRAGLIAIHPMLSNCPWFMCCLIVSQITGTVLKKMGKSDWIDPKTCGRISGTGVDLIVVSAIATLNLKTMFQYMTPLVVTAVVVAIVTFFVYTYAAKHFYDVDVVERGAAALAQGYGVVATGLLMARICDPKNQSVAQDSIAYSATLGFTLCVPYFTVGCMLAFQLSFATMLGGSIAILLAYLLVGRLFFWQKRPAWETQPTSYDD